MMRSWKGDTSGECGAEPTTRRSERSRGRRRGRGQRDRLLPGVCDQGESISRKARCLEESRKGAHGRMVRHSLTLIAWIGFLVLGFF